VSVCSTCKNASNHTPFALPGHAKPRREENHSPCLGCITSQSL
jgi:hypothetical protein